MRLRAREAGGKPAGSQVDTTTDFHDCATARFLA